MLGVVLWSNPDDKNAVIWCEDQGDLAYFQGGATPIAGWTTFPDAGDYIAFDVEVQDQMRVARNPRPIQVAAGDGLASALLSTAQCVQNGAETDITSTYENNVTQFEKARRKLKRRATFTEILAKRLG